MSTIVYSRHDLAAWVGFLRSHAAITRQLNVDLQTAHGLTLNDYEVMLHLSRAEGHMMRRVDLAESVVLTASGITRLLDGLESGGYVEKVSSESDARVTFAKLTEAGRAKLHEATSTHRAGIEDLFSSRYTEAELATLADLISRLPMTGKACAGERACG
jgi:DNA-binding MarR family transcriptional regulator